MDGGGGAGQMFANFNGEEHQHRQYEDEDDQNQFQLSSGYDNVDGSAAGIRIKHSLADDSNRGDSSAGKLFVGGIAWETSEESFSNYFSQFGEITDSVIMMDKLSGRPRGFGFVTFADPAAADKVLEEEHVIDGRPVEVKRTVPREDMQGRGVSRTKKIFVGGIPVTLTEDEMREYFSSYGNVVEHQIMLDHTTGRSRGFGFVTFDSEDAVEKIFADGQIHELGGKQVEIKGAEPKRGGGGPGGDFSNDSRPRHSGGGSSRSYGGSGRGASGYGGGYSGKAGRGGYGGYSDAGGYGGYGGGGYGGYDGYGGSYGGGSAAFYPGYGGYGYGFGYGAAMYGATGYGAAGYGTGYGGGLTGAAGGYGGGKAYYGGGNGSPGGYGGKGSGRGGSGGSGGGGGGYDGGKGYGNGGGASSGRFHPYRK